jgi:DNA modification methylase
MDGINYAIITGRAEQQLRHVPNNTVDLTVTSPPYDEMREYNGHSFNWLTFTRVARELFRVTKPGGTVVWVVGDQTINGSETLTSARQALYFKRIGFKVHDTMAYIKHGPPLTHKRYEQGWEYMFVFVKGKIKTFNPIMVPKTHPELKTRRKYWSPLR